MFADFISTFSIVFTIFGFFAWTALYWLPFVLGAIFLRLWYDYKRLEAMSKTKWILLGIRLPNNILKTPLSMEMVLAALHQSSGGNWYERWFLGEFVPWFSLELVSIGGDIHFYIRVIDKYKNYLEAQIYSQYPGVELYEAEDYTREIAGHTIGKDWLMWGTEFKLAKADPIPIKTYVDYGLDKQIKRIEEIDSRTDPLTPEIEFLGSIGKNERIWIQILIQATRKRFRDPKKIFGKRDWKSEAKDMIAKLQAKGAEGKMSKSDIEVVSAIEREISKIGFDCGIRAMYLGKEGSYNAFNIGGIVGMMKHYNSESFNSFRMTNATKVEYPWQKIWWNKDIVVKMKKSMFKAYCARGWFYPPYKKKPFVLNTEELATIYHFPGGMNAAPGVATVGSHKAEPPANLPV